MRTLNIFLCFIILISLGYNLQAEKENQSNSKKYQLKLKTGTFMPEELDATIQKRSIDMEKYCFDSYYYAILQFNEIPSFEIAQKLKSIDVHLGRYLPENSYRAKLPEGISLSELKKYDARALVFLESQQKISPELLNESDKNDVSKNIDINVVFSNEIPIDIIKNKFSEIDVEVISYKAQMEGLISISTDKSNVFKIASLPFVEFIDEYIEPDNLMSSSTVHTRAKYFQTVGAPNLTGNGVLVGVAESGIGKHADIKGRINNPENQPIDWHATSVDGVLGGNGNINPDLAGIAPSVTIRHVIANSYYDDLDIFEGVGMSASNHSYGVPPSSTNGGGTYSSTSSTYDQISKEHPSILNIYASGNSGKHFESSNHPLGYTDRFNTLARGGQGCKNTMAIGGIKNLDNINESASIGPTPDGRLKPELVAETPVLTTLAVNGYGSITGTSFSCPTVVGGVALFVERYKQEHNTNPPAGLTKAVLCNTADDLGNLGPDFTHGFGRPNFRRAVESLEEILEDPNDGKYFIDSKYTQIESENETTDNFIIDVPPNTMQLNITLYWMDAAGDPNTAETESKLINDLDIVIEKSNKRYYPWLLNHAPQSDSDLYNVETPATKAICDIGATDNDINCIGSNPWDDNGTITYRKEDHVNNIEKITIDNPESGSWEIIIDGEIKEMIPNETVEQPYFIVCEFREPTLDFSFPRGGESFEPGETFYIAWEGVGDYTGYNVEYGDDGNWKPIVTTMGGVTYTGVNLPPERLFYKWKVPNLDLDANSVNFFDHRRVKLRITGVKPGGNSIIESGYLNIMTAPDLTHNFDYNLQQSFNLSWDVVSEATKYEVYKLGNTVMEPLTGGITMNNFFTVNSIPPQGSSDWYSVTAFKEVIENGQTIEIESERAIAIEVSNTVAPSIRMFLQGPFDENTETMNSKLHELGLLPGMANKNPNAPSTPSGHPYSINPWYHSGNEGENFTDANYNPNHVDWVLVSFRFDKNKWDEFYKVAGILKSDGFIEFPTALPSICEDNFYVVVEHRNHLPVISRLQLSPGSNGYFEQDFTLPNSSYTAENTWASQIELKPGNPGIWGLFAADFIQTYNGQTTNSGDINTSDKAIWAQENGTFSQYSYGDTNLSGDVNLVDKIFFSENFGLFSGINLKTE